MHAKSKLRAREIVDINDRISQWSVLSVNHLSLRRADVCNNVCINIILNTKYFEQLCIDIAEILDTYL